MKEMKYWLCRDDYGELVLFKSKHKPVKVQGIWAYHEGCIGMHIVGKENVWNAIYGIAGESLRPHYFKLNKGQCMELSDPWLWTKLW